MSWPQGLQKQTYRINMGQGLDGHTDPKTLSSGKMLVLQNAKFVVGNRLNKRDGFAAIGTIAGSGIYFYRIFAYGVESVPIGTQQAGSFSTRAIFRYSPAANGGLGDYPAIGTNLFNPCVITTRSIQSDSHAYPQSDSCSANGFTLYAWIDGSDQGAYYRIIRESDGSVAQAAVYAGGPGTGLAAVRCADVGGYLVATASLTVAGTITVVSYNTSGATTVSNAAVASGLFVTQPKFDLMSRGMAGNIAIAYQSSLTKIQFVSVNPATAAVVTTGSFTSLVNLVAPPSLLNNDNVSVTFACVYADINSRLNYVPFNSSFTFGAATLSATNDTTISVVTGRYGGISSDVFVTSNTSAAIPQTIPEITNYSINAAGVFTTGTKTLGVAIHSKPFTTYQDGVFFWALHASQAQGQYILLSYFTIPGFSSSMLPAARTLFGQAMAGAQGTIPTSAVNVSAYIASTSLAFGSFRCAATTIGQQYSTATGLVQVPAVGAISMDFSVANNYRAVTLNNQTVIAGGLLTLYDGNMATELGYLIYPEGYTGVAGVGAGLNVGLYQYVVTYEWTDANGILHRSETGIPLSVTVSATANGTVTLTIPTLRQTLKSQPPTGFSSGRNPLIAIYRTTANASPAIFYRVGFVLNSSSVQTVSYVDSLADTLLTTNQFLYTQGGIADNFTLDGTNVICAIPDRLLASDPYNTGIVHVGIQYTPTVGIAFHSGITILLPTGYGPITNMQYMDTTLIIFYARAIFAVSGAGPTPNGQNNGFSQPQLITNGVGCDNPHAAILFADGILFKSAKGYYLLGHDLSFAPETNYIGSPVEKFNSFGCRRAVLMPDTCECRFLLSDLTTILVYNTLFKQWSTIITHSQDILVTPDGVFYAAAQSLAGGFPPMAKESIGTFTDSLVYPNNYAFNITSGWVALNQLQGCQRIYRVRLLGDFKSTHTLQVEFAYDFEGGDTPSFAETHTITSANITSGSSVWQCEVFPLRQKCQAIAMRISDPSPTGESFDMTDIEIEVGVQPGRRFPLSSLKGF